MLLVSGASVILGLALCEGNDVVRGQQEMQIQRTFPLSDSLNYRLATRLDESRIKRNWGKLKRGMRPNEVEALLGRPIKITSGVYDNSFTWYYGNRSVIFDITKDYVRYWDVQK